jgi:lipid-binding SYLF domain-containing protein
LTAGLLLAAMLAWPSASADKDLERGASTALQKLYQESPEAAALGHKAQAILVFPEIVKAGFIVGGENGEGVLFEGKKVAGYYRISAGSVGFQAGAQKFSFALFFMTPQALNNLRSSQGWAVGGNADVAVVDKGAAKNLDTTTLSHGVYAIPFGQQGLMGGVSLEGSKISEIHP